MREVLLLCWRDTSHPLGGGSERYLEEVGAALAASGVRVTLRTSRSKGADRTEFRDGMRISRGGGKYTVYPRALGAILAARFGFGPLKGTRPDVVIDTQNGVPFFARLVAAVPVILLVHHCHREQWPVAGRALGAFGWWIESWLSPRVHRRNQYMTVSLPSAEELATLGVDAGRVAVVRAGADAIPPRIQVGSAATRSETPRLCVLSRLVPHKQIEDALHAVAAVRPTMPNIQLDVIGDGWWMQPLKKTVRELAIESSVTFHGHVDEERKHELLSQSWLHVLPSRKEGWGLAVIEAAQHGVPTVGYRASKGLTDSIIDGVTGQLVDTSADLTDAVERLLTNHSERVTLGEKARVRAREFSWQQCADGVAEVLSAAAAGKAVCGLVGGASCEESVVDFSTRRQSA
ncbi:glycosyltransferase family 4 protein [Hoyosella rhizosphaerae]|uniref:Glycosyl transferase n=1 Tax=Hoyosella rhizosphaerae TaxID=1755582 RepID=A0A916U7Q3_9ACTN|nr:glycosyltransferase family 4 protein [Hoyosella rhizosphaerae]MBN4927677.1 glycosyltransferase family 4 protein [Hoyosella rhizosphaerae]GGC62556.1 putative glycosyl transferase [Hoyosella rhizosphaerae]